MDVEHSSAAAAASYIEDPQWLTDLYKFPCFTTSELLRPATSSDLGSEGFTGSLSQWQELLQVTAPDENCGLVFVRGRFPNTAGSILARAQRDVYRGSKDLFGTRLVGASVDAGLELGERKAQGWINVRWPYMNYELRQKGEPSGLSGTYEQITFIRDGTLFQVIRIRWGHGSSLGDEAVLEDASDKETITIQTGGKIRFGCPCSNNARPGVDSYSLQVLDNGERLNCISSKYQKRLEMQLVVNGAQRHFQVQQPWYQDVEVVDVSTTHQVELTIGEPTYIISTVAVRDANDISPTVNGEHFDNLLNYLGISKEALSVDRLWTAMCSPSYEANEGVEVTATARCVEQIIGVAAMPFKATRSSHLFTDPDEQGPEISNRNEENETALIQNIMSPQIVDVQGAFYQIRLLVKAHNFINTRELAPDLFDNFISLHEIRHTYLRMLRQFIASALVWLVNTNFRRSRLLLAVKSRPVTNQDGFEDRREQCEKGRVQISFEQSYNRSCYATLAVWYVMRHCPEATTQHFKTFTLLPKLGAALQSVSQRTSRDKEPTPKNDILQWYHMSCLYLICCQPFSFDGEGKPQNAFTLSPDLDIREVFMEQQRFQEFASRLKGGQDDAYSWKQEELDRVILLGEELGLSEIQGDIGNLTKAKAEQTRRRIIERKRTTRFGPGPTSWKSSTSNSNGPWELICTNHEILLQVANDARIPSARDTVFEFLTTEYTFMASWDYADSDWISKWWNLEHSSIICATLLHLKEQGKLASAKSRENKEEQRPALGLDKRGAGSSNKTLATPEEKTAEQITLDAIIQLKQLLSQDIGTLNTSSSVASFRWLRHRPRKELHPDYWISSLDDTPDLFRQRQTRDIHLRKELMRYITTRERIDLIRNAVYSVSNINGKLPAMDLRYLSCYDLSFTNRGGYQVAAISMQSEQDNLSPPALKWHRNHLFQRLNDSLVDLDTRHRILFVKRCTPALVGSMIHMYHIDSLDSVDSYFGTVSRFWETSEGLSWITSITIPHWKLSSPQRDCLEEPFHECRKDGEFPPTTIAKLGATKKQLRDPKSLLSKYLIEEKSSSIVISGELTGHLWICSLYSCLVEAGELQTIIEQTIRRTLQRFLHLQAVGRCLVFLVLLGHVCQKLAKEYEDILDQLDTIVGLGEEILLQGIDWGKSQALEKLKKMLWGLEALRAIDEKLSASLSQIQRAREAMERIGLKDLDSLHSDLLRNYQQGMEEFAKKYDLLTDIDMRTKLKIKQVAGLRDGISTVTNVEDNQATLQNAKITVRQGNNIRTLTYITIAYLPLGFVTGLFSIQHAKFMDAAKDKDFAIITTIFVLVTYGVALFLQNIIDYSTSAFRNWRAKRHDSLPLM